MSIAFEGQQAVVSTEVLFKDRNTEDIPKERALACGQEVFPMPRQADHGMG